MARKLSVAIVGAGNWGTALALSLPKAGYHVAAILGRSGPASLKAARKIAREIGADVLTDPSDIRADVIWFCVPDAEIARAADSLKNRIEWKGKTAVHSSGALSSDELLVLRRRGAAVASVHPMMTFVRKSHPSLAGVSFAIEGDPQAAKVARKIVADLGGEPYSIQKKDKAAYHAWGTFASPLLTALLATAEQVAKIAGVNGHDAKRRTLPLLRQTLKNYADFRAAEAFSGPIIRGDVETVKEHLQVLRKMPIERNVYVALALAALERLPARNKVALRNMLKSVKRVR